MIFLYKKTHSRTGLQYLGKTTKDPFTYCGSGKYWTKHLNKHGANLKTEILRECESEDEVKEWGLYYSNLWNVVDDPMWANLTPEQGDGGWINDQTGKTWKVKDSAKMGKHTNQWLNDNGTRRKEQSERMKKHNPRHLFPVTEKQREASRKASRIGCEASKKPVGYIDTTTNNEVVFESKRALIQALNISYDILNYRLATGKLYKKLKFFEVK